MPTWSEVKRSGDVKGSAAKRNEARLPRLEALGERLEASEEFGDKRPREN